MAGNEVRFDIVATDKASKQLDDVADKAEHVEKLDPTVDVKADTRAADHSIDGFADQLDRLTDADKVVVLALRAGAAQTELRDLATDLATIDAADPDVDVKFARYAEVSGQLEDLEGKIKQIGDTDVDIGGAGGANLDQARTKLQGLSEDAGQAQGAVHSMAGNAIGDFAATATGIGPLGEGLGQLTELAAGGEAGLKQLAVAGLGLGAVSAGILVLNTIMGHFADAAKHAAEIKAFNTKQIENYTDAVLAAKDALDELAGKELKDPVPAGVNQNMKDLSANTIELVDQWEKAGKIEGFDPQKDKIVDLSTSLVHAKITAEDYATAVAGTSMNLLEFEAKVRAAGLSTDTTNDLIRVAAEENKKYDEAVRDATDRTFLFTRKVDDNAAAVDHAADTQRDMEAAARHTTDALDAQSRKLDTLRSNVDNDQAWIDLQATFDDVRDSAKDAWDAASTGAEDASDKVRAHETATNNAKKAVIDYGTEVLKLPVDQVTSIVANVDDSQLDDLERRLQRIKDNANITASIILRGGAGYEGGISGPHSVPSLAAAAAPARWARVNGR